VAQIVNNFNAGPEDAEVTELNSADSGTAASSAGYGLYYNASVSGHRCVTAIDPGAEIYWETGDPALWYPEYYVRFDVYRDNSITGPNQQQAAKVVLYDGSDPESYDSWSLRFNGDGDVWLAATHGEPIAFMLGVLPPNTWITLTMSHRLTEFGPLIVSAHDADGALLDSFTLQSYAWPAGLFDVRLGRPGNEGSGGGQFWFDNVRCYNTATPRAVAPHTPETTNPLPADPDPAPGPSDPFDPAVDVVLRLTVADAPAGDFAPSTPADSLGGYVSTTDMGTGNGVLFDDISDAENRASAVDYRAVAVLNQHATITMTNAVVYISGEAPNGATIDVAVDNLGPSAVDDAAQQADIIVSPSTAPTAVGAFSAPTSPAAGLPLGDIAPGEVRVVWVRRTAHDTPRGAGGVELRIAAEVT